MTHEEKAEQIEMFRLCFILCIPNANEGAKNVNIQSSIFVKRSIYFEIKQGLVRDH